jgi:hypothetical protein
MTAFEVYLVMQASTVIGAFALAGVIALGLGAIVWGSAHDDDEPKVAAIGKKITYVSLLMLSAATFIPSTGTLAAMYVVPEITSEKWRTEAADIYALAKDALREAVRGDEK